MPRPSDQAAAAAREAEAALKAKNDAQAAATAAAIAANACRTAATDANNAAVAASRAAAAVAALKADAVVNAAAVAAAVVDTHTAADAACRADDAAASAADAASNAASKARAAKTAAATAADDAEGHARAAEARYTASKTPSNRTNYDDARREAEGARGSANVAAAVAAAANDDAVRAGVVAADAAAKTDTAVNVAAATDTAVNVAAATDTAVNVAARTNPGTGASDPPGRPEYPPLATNPLEMSGSQVECRLLPSTSSEAVELAHEAADAATKAGGDARKIISIVIEGISNQARDATMHCETALTATASAAAAARRAKNALEHSLVANVVDAANAVTRNNAAIDKAVHTAERAHNAAVTALDTTADYRDDVKVAKDASRAATKFADDATHYARIAAACRDPGADTSIDVASSARDDAGEVADSVAILSVDVNEVMSSATSATLRVEGVTCQANSTRKGRAILVTQLMKYLQDEIERTTAFQTIVPYILFLVFFAVYLDFMYLSSKQSAGLYNVNTALRENLMEDEMFKEIDTHTDFYAWLNATAKNFWVTKEEYDQAVQESGTNASELNKTRTLLVGIDRVQTGNGLFAERQNYPLHFMMLRQKRVQTEDCGSRQAKPLQAELWQRIKNSCIDKLSNAEDQGAYLRNVSHFFPNLTTPNNATPYINVTTDPFLTDDQKEPPLPEMRNSRGRSRSYSNDDKLYSAKLPYQELFLGDVESIVSDLKANDWIDFTTRVVVVETMVYNAVLREYVVLRCVVEFTHSGLLVPFSTSEPFWLMVADGGGWSTFALFCDSVFSLYFIYSVYHVWLSFSVIWLLGWESCAPWKILWKYVHLLATAFLGACLVLRCLLWGRSSTMEGLSGTDLYEDMLSYQDLFVWAKHLSTAAFWLAFLRFYKYLTYMEYCHLRVAEGIRLVAGDLFAIFFLGVVVTLGFGVVANVLYGPHLKDFDTYIASVGWLQRLVFTGDFISYDEMRDLEPWWTPIFLLVYLVITWFVLMNVALAILVAGFEAASRSTKEGVFWRTLGAGAYRSLVSGAAAVASRAGLLVAFCASVASGDASAAATPTRPERHVSDLNSRRISCIAMLRGYLKDKESGWMVWKDPENTFKARTQIILVSELLELQKWSDCFSEKETESLIKASEEQMESLPEVEGLRQREQDNVLEALSDIQEELGGIRRAVEKSRQSVRSDRRMRDSNDEL